ncbi:ly6/PLAUR domain-containing protein 5-like [Candoia aspera]|uniref:ly6/PLAUR domain-containing protein 5-like n=1 Tax=Candoia aspera TaxID=51853 RepID=UPI002FD7B7E4
MESTQLRKMTVSSLFHRFLVICLISGTSALECISSTLIQNNYPLDTVGLKISLPEQKINCSTNENACEEVQLILRIDRSALLVTHRGCATKDLYGGPESTTTGHPHYNIQSSVTYCFHDQCNANITDEIILLNPDDNKASEANDSAQCYSGLSFDSSEVIMDQVRCGKGYHQCYFGAMSVAAGSISVLTYIKTCKQSTNCTVPQSQSFGSIKLISRSSSCCVGSFCNTKENATYAPNNGHLVPTIESPSKSPDHREGYFPMNPDWDSYSKDNNNDAGNADPQFPAHSFVVPFITASRAPSVATCSFVTVLGRAILGLSW